MMYKEPVVPQDSESFNGIPADSNQGLTRTTLLPVSVKILSS